MNRLCSLILLALPFNALHAQSLPDFPFIITNGAASIEVAPDVATLAIHLLTFATESEDAVDDMTTAVNSVLTAITDNGIELEQVEATDISKFTVRADQDYNDTEILGYEISRSISAELSNLDQYEQISLAILSVDGVSRYNASFDVQNREDVEAELMAAASAEAREKAQRMATGFGVQLGGVYAISERSVYQDLSAVFGVQSAARGFIEEINVTGSAGSMLIPKTIELEQSVNAIYRLAE